MESLSIIDLNGEVLVITDLEAAIRQADVFRWYRHKDERFSDFDDRRNAYWDDVYHKLLLVRDIVSFR
jgi:hypothetical protein